jgi:hypothetical protein
LFRETTKVKPIPVFKNDLHLGTTNTGYKNINLTYTTYNQLKKVLIICLSINKDDKKLYKTFSVYGKNVKGHLEYLIKLRCEFLNIEKPKIISYNILMQNVNTMLLDINQEARLHQALQYDLDELSATDLFRHYFELQNSGQLKEKLKETDDKLYIFNNKTYKLLYLRIIKRMGINKTMYLPSNISIEDSTFDDWVIFLTGKQLLEYEEQILSIDPKDKHEKIARTNMLKSVDKIRNNADTITGSNKYIELVI